DLTAVAAPLRHDASLLGHLPLTLSLRERRHVYLDPARLVRIVCQPATVRGDLGKGLVAFGCDERAGATVAEWHQPEIVVPRRWIGIGIDEISPIRRYVLRVFVRSGLKEDGRRAASTGSFPQQVAYPFPCRVEGETAAIRKPGRIPLLGQVEGQPLRALAVDLFDPDVRVAGGGIRNHHGDALSVG